MGACAPVALLIKHDRRVTPFVAFLAPPYFLTLSHKQQDFRENNTVYNVLLFSLQLFSKTFVILRRI
jgi:hypothetical protein